jgi:uncharacterized paraquat-inducible protein A
MRWRPMTKKYKKSRFGRCPKCHKQFPAHQARCVTCHNKLK